MNIYICGFIFIMIISIILSLNGKYHIRKNFPNGIENLIDEDEDKNDYDES
jgi:hypothetical protein